MVHVQLNEIENYALENNIPIMQKDGIDFLTQYIKENNIEKILEIGSAIGYSAIKMSLVKDSIEVTTIERDIERYNIAVNNINKFNLTNRINIILGDALDVKLDDKFDLIFIDAAKSQYIKFFEKFEKNLKESGTIITDNMNFHGLVETKPEEIKSRNLRALVRKVKNYKTFLKENSKYETEFLDIGDGIAVSRLK